MAVHQRTAITNLKVDRNPEEAFAISSTEDVAAGLASIVIVNYTLATAATVVAIGSLRKLFDSFGGSADHLHFVS